MVLGLACAEIKHINSDSAVFDDCIFQLNCAEKNELQSFSGVCAHHQNVHAEHPNNHLHGKDFWSEYGVDSLVLGPFAIKHVTWLYN